MTVSIFFVLFLYPAAAAQDYLTVKGKRKTSQVNVHQREATTVSKMLYSLAGLSWDVSYHCVCVILIR